MYSPTADLERYLTRLGAAWLGLFSLAYLLAIWPGDVAVIAWLRENPVIEILRPGLAVISRHAMYPFYLLFLIMGFLAWRRRDDLSRRLVWGYWLSQLLGSVLIVRPLKMTLGRARPYAGDNPGLGLEWIGPTWDSSFFGFPSGHAADLLISALFTALLFRHRGVTLLVLSFAALVAFTRLALNVHYPSDVAGGLFIGGVVALGVARFWVLPYWQRHPAGNPFFSQGPDHHPHVLHVWARMAASLEGGESRNK